MEFSELETTFDLLLRCSTRALADVLPSSMSFLRPYQEPRFQSQCLKFQHHLMGGQIRVGFETGQVDWMVNQIWPCSIGGELLLTAAIVARGIVSY